MKLFDYFRKEKRNNEPQGVQYVRPYTSGALFFGKYDSGSPMSLSAVFAAVDIISNAIAELPIQVKKQSGDTDEIIHNHLICRLFNQMLISKFTAVKQIIVDMLLFGNGYIYIRRGSNGMPVELVYIPAGSITINYEDTTGKLTYIYTGSNKTIARNITPKNILHFYKNSYDGIRGRGILSYASRTVVTSNYTEEAAKDYFGSGCGIKGILKFNEQVMDIDKEEIRSNWQQVHGGSNGSGLAVCDYNVDFIPVSQNAKESQMIESRLFNVTEVARFFGISPVLLQDLSHSSYSTIEASQLEFLSHTLLPYISLIESELNRKLADENVYIDLDETYLMTTDKQAQANYLHTLLSAGIISINEARKMINLGEIEGGDKHIIAYTDINQNTIEGADDNKKEE